MVSTPSMLRRWFFNESPTPARSSNMVPQPIPPFNPKRKAESEISSRPAKQRMLSTPSKTYFTDEEYANADLYAGSPYSRQATSSGVRSGTVVAGRASQMDQDSVSKVKEKYGLIIPETNPRKKTAPATPRLSPATEDLVAKTKQQAQEVRQQIDSERREMELRRQTQKQERKELEENMEREKKKRESEQRKRKQQHEQERERREREEEQHRRERSERESMKHLKKVDMLTQQAVVETVLSKSRKKQKIADLLELVNAQVKEAIAEGERNMSTGHVRFEVPARSGASSRSVSSLKTHTPEQDGQGVLQEGPEDGTHVEIAEEQVPISGNGDPTEEVEEAFESESQPNDQPKETIEETEDLKNIAAETRVNTPVLKYAFRDTEIRDRIYELQNLMESFAEDFFSFYFKSKSDLTEGLQRFPEDTVSVIENIASGGPGGEDGWRRIFTEVEKRRALVCGIIGKVLVEDVFMHRMFGANKENHDQIKSLKSKGTERERTAQHATTVRSILGNPTNTPDHIATLPESFHPHVAHTVAAILNHLRPIISLKAPSNYVPGTAERMQSQLNAIVSEAGLLSLSMSMDPNNAYFFRSPIKDGALEGDKQEIVNFEQMRETNPRSRKDKSWRAVKKEKERAQDDEPIVQIALLNGITVCRPEGWEGEGSQTEETLSKILTWGWVYCRWGRPYRSEDGNAEDQKQIHGDAWINPGFVQFREITGVLGSKSKNKKLPAKPGRKRLLRERVD